MRIKRSKYTDYAWYKGDLAWLLRPHGQTQVRDFIASCSTEEDTVEPIVINAHRRLGKSFLNVLMAVETCLKAPNLFAKYVCGEKDQVREIVEPLLWQILETCPPDIYPAGRTFRLKFRNPAWERPGHSYLQLVGANYRKGNMGRGQACDVAFLDEVRDFNHLRYFHESVLLYQFVGRDDPKLVMTSTVPWSMDHDFTRPESGYIPEALRKGRYFCLPASKNPDYTARDKKLVLSSIPGGEKDASYQREAECKLIGDVGRMITPEYHQRHSILAVEAYDEPEFFVPWVCMDTGFDPDATAILWGYIDWLPQLLVFRKCHVQRRMTTKDIAEVVIEGTKELGWDKTHHRVKRVSDIDERGLVDLRRDYRLSFLPVIKHSAESALTAFRAKLQQEMIRVVVPDCPDLDYQLLHGIWNEKGTDYHRSDKLGHWDAGKAAVYLNRMINWNVKPYPDNWKGGLPLPKVRYDERKIESWGDVLLTALGRKVT